MRRRTILILSLSVVALLAGGLLGGTNPALAAANSIASPDTAGVVGPFSSLALDASGFPVIAYFDVTNFHLKVLHCTNANCNGSQTPYSPDTTGRVGEEPSLALDASGFPVIAYDDYDNNEPMKVLHCTNANCSGNQTSYIPDPASFLSSPSLALDASGFPVVSYYDAVNGDLKVLHCANANCSGNQTPYSPDTFGDVGGRSSLALDASGFPVVSYTDITNFDLKVLHCSNANCSGNQTPVLT